MMEGRMNHRDAASDANDIMTMHDNCAHGLHGVCNDLAHNTHLTYDEVWARLVLALKLEVTRILEEHA